MLGQLWIRFRTRNAVGHHIPRLILYIIERHGVHKTTSHAARIVFASL